MHEAEKFLRLAVPQVDWDEDEHLSKTPIRFFNMIQELTTPIQFDFTKFKNSEHAHDMVVVQAIPFSSLCKHHVVPFVGLCHIAYIPDDYIAGLSKFARAVKYFAKGLWTQEDLTALLCEFLVDELAPVGVGIIMEAEHMCMTIRGVQSPGTKTTTSAMRGAFIDPTKEARQEFLSLIGKG